VKDFDDQERVYKSITFSVDQILGTISAMGLVTNSWFDRRSQVMKTSLPGGLVSENQYDGAGRTKKTFTTDGGGDTGWSNADDVTGDNVLSQVENQYDAASNIIMTISKERFHDETATGGAGGDLPTYVGAVPPEGVEPWDWDKTWKARARKFQHQESKTGKD